MGFTYFYTAFTFKPDETADQLRKNGGFIPGSGRAARPRLPGQGRDPHRVRRRHLPRHRGRRPVPGGDPVPDLGGYQPGRHGPAHRRVRRGRDDEADRGAVDDAQLRRLHPVTRRPGCRPRLTRANGRQRKGPTAMTVFVLLGAPGAGKGTQAPVLAKPSRRAHISSGDLFRAAVADWTRWAEARRYMERGQLVPDDMISACSSTGSGSRRRRRGDPRRLSTDRGPRPRRSTPPLAERGKRSTRRLHRGAGEELITRLAGRWICTAPGHVYHVSPTRRARTGVCDLDGSPLIQRADDQPETIRARLAQQLAADARRRRPLRRARGPARRSTAASRSTTSPRTC